MQRTGESIAAFFAFINAKIGSKREENAVIYRGLLCVKTSLCQRPCMCKSFCATPPASFLSGHAVVQFQSATLFLVEECKEQVKASQVKKLNINSAQSAVIHSILRCQMARTHVNTTVLVPESGPNTVIYSVSFTSQSSIF